MRKVVPPPSPSSMKSFEALLQQYQTSLYRLAYRLAGNYEDAHDLFGEASLRGLRFFESRYDSSQASFISWMRSIMLNVFKDRLRKNARHQAISLDRETGTGTTLKAELPSYEPSVADQVIVVDEATTIRQMIALLPVHYRDILVEFHFEQLSYQEIASKHRIPLGTVRSRMNRARVMFRQRFVPNQNSD